MKKLLHFCSNEDPIILLKEFGIKPVLINSKTKELQRKVVFA
jgi:hypothetical protein